VGLVAVDATFLHELPFCQVQPLPITFFPKLVQKQFVLALHGSC
jgi:hypothetical protein